MSIFDRAAAELASRQRDDGDETPRGSQGATASAVQGREVTVVAGGEEVTVENPDTVQTDEEGNWLTASQEHGRPRGIQALENRQIVQTSAMQAIVNAVASNIVGGDLVFEAVDDVMEDLSDVESERAGDLRTLLRDVLTGPHLKDESLDDLIVAAVEDMMGPGQAVWQLLPSENGTLPVAAMMSLDPLTIRHTRDKHGVFQDPPYWQANTAFQNGGLAAMGNIEPTPLDHEDVAVMSYPLGNRSYQSYPISPAWQVREWLEILANSTTHHNRYYSDNEIPPGLLQVVNASPNTISDIQEKIEDASGDPRDAPVVGGEGGAQWIEMGGTSINLNIIEEQRWFFFLCLGSLGLGKQELGFVEDVNRSNGEVEASRVYKRVTGPFIDQFEQAFKKAALQFDVYRDLGQPFRPTIDFSDPRAERAREERLRSMYQAGGLTLREYVRRRGDEDLAEDEDKYVVEIDGQRINYGDHPQWVAKRLMSELNLTDPEEGEAGGDEPEGDGK